jgi:antitoxin component YwqK of YwqJK toxin-antitoxin module
MNQLIDGVREGYWEWYHSNGKLYIKGNYISGNREGYWEYYYSNGKLEKQEIFI